MPRAITAYQLNRFRFAYALRQAGWTYVAIGKEFGVSPKVAAKIVLCGEAVAVTIPEAIQGFRGARYRWWERDVEVPFPDWNQS